MCFLLCVFCVSVFALLLVVFCVLLRGHFFVFFVPFVV